MTEPVRFEKYTKTKVADTPFFIGFTGTVHRVASMMQVTDKNDFKS